MSKPIDNACCARLPHEALPLLAHLRSTPGVQAALTERHAWIRWEAGDTAVLQAVLPIHAADLFEFHEGDWRSCGRCLPAFDFPKQLEYQPLAHVLFPQPVRPIPPPTLRAQAFRPTLKRDGQPRQTAALLGSLAALLDWSHTVPTARLASLQGVRLGARALVLGDDLPLLPESERFWGQDVLVPLGYVPEPALPESTFKDASGLQADEILLWQPAQAEVIEKALFSPLSRAALRLAAGGLKP